MSEMKLRDVVPNKEYRVLMLKLSGLLSSSEDTDKLKYMLTSRIPAGIKEKLLTPLEVFIFLEKSYVLGPKKFHWLHELFLLIEKPDLSAMVLNFIIEHGEETFI